MPQKPSIAAAIARMYQSVSPSSPESKFRWAEHLLILVTALNQLAWKRAGSGTEITTVAVPIALLFVLSAVNSQPVAQSNGRRMVQILGELALVTIAGFLGPHRVYRQLYFIVIGKAALLLKPQSLLIVILLAVIQQVAFVTMVELTPIRYALLFPSLLSRQSIMGLEYFVYYALALLLVVLISMLLKSEQENRRRAEQMRLEMDSMAMTLERERIARDIHDSLGHALTGLNVQLQLAQKVQDSDPPKSREAIALTRGFAIRAVADVRRAVRAVRDSYFNLPTSVQELVDTIESTGDCKVTTTLDRQSLPPKLAHNLFCLIQESLTNAQRHAHATSIILEPTCNDHIHLGISDNGIGFSKEDAAPGFGIAGMEERVASLEGTITIASAAGKGTSINITIPIKLAPTKDGSDDQSSRG